MQHVVKGPIKKTDFSIGGLEKNIANTRQNLCDPQHLITAGGQFLHLCIKHSLIYSRAGVCGRLLPGIAGSNLAGDMDVFLWWVFCVVR
jgi:hypothetical protein